MYKRQLDDLDPGSERILPQAWIEPAAAETPIGETVQFERLGYFCADPDSEPGAPVFDRTVTLKDTWARLQKQGRQEG